MADEAPESEQPEIIPKPPSHPITTSLLIISSVATLIAIGFVWNELFGNYLLSKVVAAKEVDMGNHQAEKLKQKSGMIDHYDLDFPSKGETIEYQVKQDVHIGQKFEEAAGGSAGQ